jgi:hypothetical protein
MPTFYIEPAKGSSVLSFSAPAGSFVVTFGCIHPDIQYEGGKTCNTGGILQRDAVGEQPYKHNKIKKERAQAEQFESSCHMISSFYSINSASSYVL